AFSRHCLHDVRVTQVQLDELFALLSAVKTGEGSEAQALKRLSRSPHWVHRPRRQAPGSAPKPRWMPLPQLLYAQVVKTVRRRRLVRVSHRVVFGTSEAVPQVLAAYGWQINTSFIERVNLSIRQHVAAVGRR